MPEENNGGLDNVPLPDGPSDAVAALLRQLAGVSGTVQKIKIELDLNLPATGGPETPPSGTAGSWVRQKAANGDTIISWVPDDPQAAIVREIIDVAAEMDQDKDTWTQLLEGNQGNQVDIDQGITLLWVYDDEDAGVITWLPNDAATQPKRRELQETATAFDPGAGLAEFRQCMRNSAGLGRAAALRQCSPQLLR